ncbi:MAG: alpha/beta fold hydrolase [Planctomycetia bacterium]|nr:alpha/beta fold hydrolase [Planctomycetia bacterium]
MQKSKSFSAQRGCYVRRWTTVLAAFVATALPGIASAQFKTNKLPAPNGPAACGRTTFVWVDPKRAETWTEDPADRREFLATLWYPARVDDSAKTGPYCPYANWSTMLKGIDRVAATNMATHSFDDAPLAPRDAPYPVLVLLPGGGTPSYDYTALAEELASHGYVVAAVEHSYEGRGQAFPDGRVIEPVGERRRPDPNAPDAEQAMMQFYRDRVDIRAADAVSALDQLAQVNAEDRRFTGRLDLAKVGVFGHSVGGVAATQACALDSRFKAAVNIDGLARSMPMYLAADGSAIRQPCMYLGKPLRGIPAEARARLKISDEQARKMMAEATDRLDGTLAKVAGGAYRVQIAGAVHASFADDVYFLPTDEEKKNHITALAREYLRAFFDQTLSGQESKTLAAGREAREGVIVDRFPPH